MSFSSVTLVLVFLISSLAVHLRRTVHMIALFFSNTSFCFSGVEAKSYIVLYILWHALHPLSWVNGFSALRRSGVGCFRLQPVCWVPAILATCSPISNDTHGCTEAHQEMPRILCPSVMVYIGAMKSCARNLYTHVSARRACVIGHGYWLEQARGSVALGRRSDDGL